MRSQLPLAFSLLGILSLAISAHAAPKGWLLVANKGDIVVAMINDEATVKYFHPEPEKDQIVFKPANQRLQPIVVKRRDFKSVNLIGLVVGVYRRL